MQRQKVFTVEQIHIQQTTGRCVRQLRNLQTVLTISTSTISSLECLVRLIRLLLNKRREELHR